MPIQDNPLYRRLHQHAQKRLVFDAFVCLLGSVPVREERATGGVALLGRAALHDPPGLGERVEGVCELRGSLHLRVDVAEAEAQASSVFYVTFCDLLAASRRCLA